MSPKEACARLNAELARYPELSMKEWYRSVYLHSDHWKQLSAAARDRAGGKCKRCRTRGPLDVHHKEYRYIFDVGLRDLEALCRLCHDLEHGKITPPKGRKLRKKVGVGKLPPCPVGVEKRHWHAWIMGGQKGAPPVPNVKPKRPAGVPKKAWKEYVAGGMRGDPPAPVPGLCKYPANPKLSRKLFHFAPSSTAIDLAREAALHARRPN